MIKVGDKFICIKVHNIYSHNNTKIYHPFEEGEAVEIVQDRLTLEYTLGCKTSLRFDIFWLDVEELLNENFLSIAEWRNKQIDSILEDE